MSAERLRLILEAAATGFLFSGVASGYVLRGPCCAMRQISFSLVLVVHGLSSIRIEKERPIAGAIMEVEHI